MPSNGHSAGDGANPELDAIKAEIEATREQLGRTVDELSARLDVPARARGARAAPRTPPSRPTARARR